MLNGPQIRSEVAVIVPCYNVERYLARAVDSVFAQTYRDFHIYAVDDASSDGTANVLRNYTPHCSMISQIHGGPAAARNRAIRMSDTPFVAFLDADDEWLPPKLERQIALMKQDSSLGLVCSLSVVSGSDGETCSAPTADKLPGSGRLFRHLVRNCFVFTPTVVVRRRCLDEVGLFNESLAVSEDFNLWLRIAARWNIALLPEVLTITHKRPGSLSVRLPTQERLRNGVAALKHVWSSCPDLPAVERGALRRVLAERTYCYGSCLISEGAKGPGRHQLMTALRLQPTHWRALTRAGLSFFPRLVSDSLVGLKKILVGSAQPEESPRLTPKDGSQFDGSVRSKATATVRSL